ncbi:NAD(P)/FAD-dependent oxidoreductase [Sulfuriroseicoccus oceanibius]|uniref:FAD-binding protein n=1 Tax=Sulfuriroseicoccus oceanibius TaxID=2707525 RepID=A0A6B3L1X3_9BACT|nr:FAD-binding protein [Sulfuriroseicoccus oceanibius]QQL45533.1 FAD-binding protein [Sulfuriroseicoccus oceanibius]
MIKECEIALTHDRADDEQLWKKRAARALKIHPNRITGIELTKQSIDARKAPVKFRLRLKVTIDEAFEPTPQPEANEQRYPSVSGGGKPRVIIVGCGPTGMFAALECLRQGLQPVILERGKDASARRYDLRPILMEGRVLEDSNYCFGEGGAGTFSDGKLYTRATKRGDVMDVYETLVAHGAKPDILTDAHPHIGSNALPNVIKSMRTTILERGGEVHFESKVVDLLVEGKGNERRLSGVRTADGKEWLGDAVVIAAGHSARDILRLLDSHQVTLEAKPFAVGVRIEHPQPMIDSVQYHLPRGEERPHSLPAAAYRVACKIEGRGVHSFCMCPGGFIVPASTANDEVVVNGMSLAKRDSPFANSGLVVTVEPEDTLAFAEEHGALAGIAYQSAIEHAAKKAGGGGQAAPAQLTRDFMAGRISEELRPTSYKAGLNSSPLHELLPKGIVDRMRTGLKLFGKQLEGFIGEESQMIGFETRTSCPVRVPRDPETLESPDLKRLIPAGEGAGYAGGIVSAALDGIRVAKAAKKLIH